MSTIDLTAFKTAYPDKPVKFALPVASDLLTRPHLVKLSTVLPDHLVEYNRGSLPVSIAPDAVPGADLPAPEVIEKIGECDSWMVLRNVEKNAPYKDLINSLIDRVRPVVEPATGPTLREEAFIFISSPAAVTPLHIDEEHNILIQIEGSKTVTVYSPDDRKLVSQEKLERFHTGGHRNITLEPDYQGEGSSFVLNPGDALHSPPLAPHWVRVMDDAPSISLSVTWRSRRTMRHLYLHQINHARRARGQAPRFPGESPLTDQLKIWKQSTKVRIDKLLGR